MKKRVILPPYLEGADAEIFRRQRHTLEEYFHGLLSLEDGKLYIKK